MKTHMKSDKMNTIIYSGQVVSCSLFLTLEVSVLQTKDYRSVLNAYKNGVAPTHIPNALMVGRKDESGELKRCFSNTADGISCFKWIVGEYGAGKTFLLNHVKAEALEDDFIVSHIQIDKTFRFNNLEQMYYKIMHNIFVKSVANRKCSFDDLFDIWIENLQNTPNRAQSAEEINRVIETLNRFNNAFSRSFLTYIRARIKKDTAVSEAVAAWITGEKNIPLALKKQFGIVGAVDKFNMMDFMRAFTHLITLLGYKGFIVLVDELDLIVDERSDIRHSAYANIRQLIDLISTGELKQTFFILSGTPRLLHDEKGVSSYGALAQRLGHAIDPLRKNMGDLRQPVIWLSPLGHAAYGEFTDALYGIYKEQYDVELKISTDSLKNWVLLSYHKEGADLKSLTFRDFATKLLEILDIIQQNPKNNVFRSELLATEKNGQVIFKTKSISG